MEVTFNRPPPIFHLFMKMDVGVVSYPEFAHPQKTAGAVSISIELPFAELTSF